MFSGNAYIELRPPEDIEDLRAFTALNLTLHRPIPRGDGKRRRRQTDEGDNSFVLYLGNKNVRTLVAFLRSNVEEIMNMWIQFILLTNRHLRVTLALS